MTQAARGFWQLHTPGYSRFVGGTFRSQSAAESAARRLLHKPGQDRTPIEVHFCTPAAGCRLVARVESRVSGGARVEHFRGLGQVPEGWTPEQARYAAAGAGVLLGGAVAYLWSLAAL